MKRFGWLPDYPDYRDREYGYKAKTSLATVPMVVDNITAPVRDQGDLGSCVFFAITTMMSSAQVANDKDEWLHFSPLYAYYRYRAKMGTIEYDGGASIREAMKLIKDEGVCREGLWPYQEFWWATPPLKEAAIDAADHQILSYHALDDLIWMIACLADGYGFVCGISVYESFMDVGQDGLVKMPDKKESWLGGHAVYIYGYDTHRGVFLGQNSWGTGWGRDGRFAIPFEYLKDRGLASDFWTVRLVEGE